MTTKTQKTPYWQLLQDPRWQKKRLEILEARHWRCEKCDRGLTDGRQFHAHHRYYVKDRMPWEYPDFCYEALCDECHEKAHDDPTAMAGWEMLMEVLCSRTSSGVNLRFIAENLRKDFLPNGPRATSLLCAITSLLREYGEELKAFHDRDCEIDHWYRELLAAQDERERVLGRRLTDEEEVEFTTRFRL